MSDITVVSPTITEEKTLCEYRNSKEYCQNQSDELLKKYQEQNSGLEQPSENIRDGGIVTPITGTPISPTETSKSNTSFVVGGIVLGFVCIVVALVVVMRRTSK